MRSKRSMKFLLAFVCLGLVGYATIPVAQAQWLVRPSVSDTEAVEFLGKTFELHYKAIDQPVHIYEYFPIGEAPNNWFELVQFQVYPVHPNGNEPLDHAQRTAMGFLQKYPYMQVGLYVDDRTGAAILDFFDPDSNRREDGTEYLEFSAFKFFRDADSSHTIGFHYAKNIESTNPSRDLEDVTAEIIRTREEVLPALMEFPLYRR